jgi:uncharacterized membrane protein
MQNKPNIPGEIFPTSKQEYSWRTDLRVNGWLMAAVLMSAASDFFFVRQVRELDVTWRTLIALAPFPVLMLWVRAFAQWVRGMDELHRRITQAAVLFAVGVTSFLVMLWHRLEVAGFFDAVCPGRKGWDIGTLCHVLLLMILFYILGHTRFSRRYN